MPLIERRRQNTGKPVCTIALASRSHCLVGRTVSEGNRDDIAFLRVTDMRDTAAVVAVTKLGETSKIVSSFADTLIAAVSTPADR